MDYTCFSLDNIPNEFNPKDFFDPKGRFIFDIIRKDGSIEHQEFPNGITNEGKNYILDTMFNSQTQIAQSAWCIGLISNSGTPTLAAADTMASHAWSENVSYSQSTRVAWGPGNASSQQVTNASAATFDITGTDTLYGVFMASNNTKSGTSGILWTTAAFASTIPVTSGDQIKISYAIAC